MSLQALLFDVDGTLADTERLGHRPAYNKAFKELGLSWKWGPKLYRALLKLPGGRERLHHYLDKYDPDLGEHAEPAKRDPKEWVGDVHKAKSRYFQELVERGEIPLRAGVARLMREALANDVKLAIVTNASRATLQPVLDHSLGSELSQAVQLIVCGEQVARKKPSPDLYLHALRHLQVDAADCVAVEDSAMGLRAAVAAGIPTVITVNQNTEHEDFSEAMLVVEDLGDPGDEPAVLRGGPLPGEFVNLRALRDLLAARSALPEAGSR